MFFLGTSSLPTCSGHSSSGILFEARSSAWTIQLHQNAIRFQTKNANHSKTTLVISTQQQLCTYMQIKWRKVQQKVRVHHIGQYTALPWLLLLIGLTHIQGFDSWVVTWTCKLFSLQGFQFGFWPFFNLSTWIFSSIVRGAKLCLGHYVYPHPSQDFLGSVQQPLIAFHALRVAIPCDYL